MPSFLTSLGAKIAAIAAIAAVIGFLLLMWRLDAAKLTAAQAQISQLAAVNKQNVAELDKLKTDYQRAQTAAAAKAAEAQASKDQLARIEAENAHAQGGNNPVCPVVGRTLDELLEPASPGADPRSSNAGSR